MFHFKVSEVTTAGGLWGHVEERRGSHAEGPTEGMLAWCPVGMWQGGIKYNKRVHTVPGQSHTKASDWFGCWFFFFLWSRQGFSHSLTSPELVSQNASSAAIYIALNPNLLEQEQNKHVFEFFFQQDRTKWSADFQCSCLCPGKGQTIFIHKKNNKKQWRTSEEVFFEWVGRKLTPIRTGKSKYPPNTYANQRNCEEKNRWLLLRMLIHFSFFTTLFSRI